MIIYRDVVYGSELFSDTLKPKLLDDDTDCFTWESKRISESSGDIDASLLGGNASQEEAAEETESATKQGFDFEIYGTDIQHVGDMTLKDFKLWFKAYAKKVVAALTAKGQTEKAEAAKASATKFFQKFGDKEKLKELDFYSGPQQDDDELGMVWGNLIIVAWNDDGMSATCTCWRGGLYEEKC